jgi:predicted RNase H-like HicB family nuclease
MIPLYPPTKASADAVPSDFLSRFISHDILESDAVREEYRTMFRRLYRRRIEKTVPSLMLKVSIVVERDGEGFYAYAPALDGLHVYGDTETEALEYVREAVDVYLASLAKHNDPLPIGTDLTVDHAPLPEVPAGASLRDIRVSWPTPRMSGAN